QHPAGPQLPRGGCRCLRAAVVEVLQQGSPAMPRSGDSSVRDMPRQRSSVPMPGCRAVPGNAAGATGQRARRQRTASPAASDAAPTKTAITVITSMPPLLRVDRLPHHCVRGGRKGLGRARQEPRAPRSSAVPSLFPGACPPVLGVGAAVSIGVFCLRIALDVIPVPLKAGAAVRYVCHGCHLLPVDVVLCSTLVSAH